MFRRLSFPYRIEPVTPQGQALYFLRVLGSIPTDGLGRFACGREDLIALEREGLVERGENDKGREFWRLKP